MNTFTCYSCGKDIPYSSNKDIKTILVINEQKDNERTLEQFCLECDKGFRDILKTN